MPPLNVTLLYFDAKAPTDRLDYVFDFGAAPWLTGTDTIASATVTALPSGLTIDTVSNTAKTVVGWISGGSAGTEYQVSANVVTAQGRTASRSAILYVQSH